MFFAIGMLFGKGPKSLCCLELLPQDDASQLAFEIATPGDRLSRLRNASFQRPGAIDWLGQGPTRTGVVLGGLAQSVAH